MMTSIAEHLTDEERTRAGFDEVPEAWDEKYQARIKGVAAIAAVAILSAAYVIGVKKTFAVHEDPVERIQLDQIQLPPVTDAEPVLPPTIDSYIPSSEHTITLEIPKSK